MPAPTIPELLDTMDYGPSPESPKPALAWLDEHQRRFGHFIGGQWCPGSGHFASVNPADGSELAQVAQAGAAEVEAAVQAAQAAQPAWAALGGPGRARHLYALARALQRHARVFSVLETLDNGKPFRETRDVDVPLAVRHFYHHAGWAQLLDAEFAGHEALGVVGQIVPWNFPLLMLAWKIAPALACGNTVVFKPAEQTSLTALRFADLCREVGLPPGVVNVVTGDGAVGQAIVDHPGIAKIAFTGSTEVGRAIRRATAGSGKRLSLELGGKSPFIVFHDADLDAAVEGLVESIWFNQGQVCCAGSRLLVQEGVAARLTAKLERRIAQIRVGDPLDKSTDMGALVDRTQWQRVHGYVERARAEGARIVQAPGALAAVGGAGASLELDALKGCYYPPTLVCDVESSFEIVRDEVFGPVLTVQTFRTPAEAVELANNTAYGLAACVYSESVSLALDVAPRLKAGVVWINAANLFDAACGFGGYRESGFGREGGREGLREYLRRVAGPAGQTAATGAAPGGVAQAAATREGSSVATGAAAIDRSPKFYVGGKQARPDGGTTRVLQSTDGSVIGSVPEGNRKDIRNAVEAARSAEAWSRQSAHGRAQVLYYLAENLDAQRARVVQVLGTTLGEAAAQAEVDQAIGHLFTAAAWADKHDGAVHQPPLHGVVLALNEPMGVIALIAPDASPLAGLLALAAPAMAMGNRVVVVPSRRHPLVSAELTVLADTSDLPGGVLNLVTGDADALGDTLAAHSEVMAFWAPQATPAQAARFEALSAATLKRTWVAFEADGGPCHTDAREVLEQATQVKNVWVPYGT